VVAQLVPFVHQAAHDLLVAGDMLANHEKCGTRVMRRQDIQDARRRRGVRAVVERQRDERACLHLLKEDVREAPAEPADHRTRSEQRSDDDRDQAKQLRGSLTHEPWPACRRFPHDRENGRNATRM
jgi:hypothetical protein